jgi:GT2 family glycosyltransferase
VFGVVLNHHWKPSQSPVAIESTRLALTLLGRCAEVSQTVLVDSSTEQTPGLEEFCAERGARYLHKRGGLTFSEAFNRGAAQIERDWVALLCSDVYVYSDTFTAFSDFIADWGDLPIGCLIPYLSKSDVQTQIARARRPQRFDARVPTMSLNLNVFPKTALERIGGVPDEFTGDYNDFAMCIALRRSGLDVFIVKDAFALHYGYLTKHEGHSINLSENRERFAATHPDFYDAGSIWTVSFDRLIYSRSLRVAWRAASAVNRARARLGARPLSRPFNWILRETPSRQRLPGRDTRRGSPRSLGRAPR